MTTQKELKELEKERVKNHKRFCRDLFIEKDQKDKIHDEKTEKITWKNSEYGLTVKEKQDLLKEFNDELSEHGKKSMELNLKLMKSDCYKDKYYPKDLVRYNRSTRNK